MRRFFHHCWFDLHTAALKLDVLTVRFNAAILRRIVASLGLLDGEAVAAGARGGAVRALRVAAELGLEGMFGGGRQFAAMQNRAAPKAVQQEEVAALLEGLAVYNDSTRPLSAEVEAVVREVMREYARRGDELLGEYASLEEYMLRVTFAHMGEQQHHDARPTAEQLRYFFRSFAAGRREE